MTVKTSVFNQALKDELVDRISSHVEEEVRDYLNVRFLAGEITSEEHDELSEDIMFYLEGNLSIFIK